MDRTLITIITLWWNGALLQRCNYYPAPLGQAKESRIHANPTDLQVSSYASVVNMPSRRGSAFIHVRKAGSLCGGGKGNIRGRGACQQELFRKVQQ